MDGLKKDVEAKMDGMEDKMDGLKKGMEAKKDSLNKGVEAKMNGMEAKMEGKMEDLKTDLTKLYKVRGNNTSIFIIVSGRLICCHNFAFHFSCQPECLLQ